MSSGLEPRKKRCACSIVGSTVRALRAHRWSLAQSSITESHVWLCFWACRKSQLSASGLVAAVAQEGSRFPARHTLRKSTMMVQGRRCSGLVAMFVTLCLLAFSPDNFVGRRWGSAKYSASQKQAWGLRREKQAGSQKHCMSFRTSRQRIVLCVQKCLVTMMSITCGTACVANGA